MKTTNHKPQLMVSNLQGQTYKFEFKKKAEKSPFPGPTQHLASCILVVVYSTTSYPFQVLRIPIPAWAKIGNDKVSSVRSMHALSRGVQFWIFEVRMAVVLVKNQPESLDQPKSLSRFLQN